MGKSIQHDIVKSNPGRINLMVDVQTGDAMKRVELPLRVMAIGDFAGRPTEAAIVDREPVNVNKDNFDDVLRSLDVGAELIVPDRQGAPGDETKVALRFDTLKAFHPEQVAQQVPQIVRLVAMRNLLSDLRNRVINAAEFRKGLERIVNDPSARAQLVGELAALVGAEGTTDGGADR
jgi:type VI secretion system protein ImpB